MQEQRDESITDKMRAQARSHTFPAKTEKSSLNFTGSFGRHHITPRGLKANMLNKLVKVQGIVTRMSVVHPKLTKSYHFVEATKQGVVKTYADNYSINEDAYVDKTTHFPTEDVSGNRMTPEYGY